MDILVVGWFGTTAGISGVSTGSSIVNLVTFTITGLAMGVTVVMGQYLGEMKPEKVGQVVGGAICLFLVLAFIIAAAMLVFARMNGSFRFLMIKMDKITLTACAITVASAAPATFQ